MLRAIVVCSLVLGCVACNLEHGALGREFDAGKRTESQMENGGADLVAEPKPARPRREAPQPPAADSGEPAAEAQPEAGPPASPSTDAGPQEPPAQQPMAMAMANPAADGGTQDASVEDDAGEEDPDQPETCTTHDCLCESFCERGLALGCLDEPPLADCLTLCRRPIAPGCEAEELAALRCKVELPAPAYVCDDLLWTFVVVGCEAEDGAAKICRKR